MLCGKCGRELPSGSVLCPECGAICANDTDEGDYADPGCGTPYVSKDTAAVSNTEEAFSSLPEQRGYYLSGRPPMRRRLGKALAVIFGCLFVIGIAAALLWTAYDAGLIGTVSVPDVMGMSEAEARTTIEAAGFNVSAHELDVDDGVGQVVSLNPTAGSALKRGSTIEVEIGRARVLPEVVGLQIEAARTLLEEAGAQNIKILYENSYDEEEGRVLSMSPRAGGVFRSDDALILTVAQPYTVPDISGLDLTQAQEAIEKAGLICTVVWQDSELDAYTVLSSNPSSGTRLEEGQEVLLLVSAPGARSEMYLSDYLEASGGAVSDYLQWKGWSFYGGTYQIPPQSFIYEQWYKADVGSLLFTPNPETAHFVGDSYESQLGSGATIQGVRFMPELIGAFADPQLSEDYLMRIVEACGFASPTDSCTNETISAPMLPDEYTGNSFIALCGERDEYMWYASVSRSDYDGTYWASVSCAHKTLYEGIDLSEYDMRLVNYLAYIDHYTG